MQLFGTEMHQNLSQEFCDSATPNHCIVFHIHRERTDALDHNSIAKEFALANVRLIAFFGHFEFYLIIFGPIKIDLYAIMNFIKCIKSFSVYYPS